MGGTMNGGSLGLRSSSYGSLNGGGFAASVAPALPGRKAAKIWGGGARERERTLGWAFKAVSRRKVGILILVLISVAVFSFLSVIFRDQGASSSHDSVVGLQSFAGAGKPQLNNSASDSSQLSLVVNNISHPLAIILPPSISVTHHPCEGFSFPPPPADRKRTGPRPCPVCYLPAEQAVASMPHLPTPSPVLKILNYVQEDDIVTNESNEGSMFGGHQSLLQRADSFDIKESMTVHCGFAKGRRPGQGTGFDINEYDLHEMENCHSVVVASAIFGNYDIMQQPENISEFSRESVCFYMFVDEETEAYIKNSSTVDDNNRVGLWRVVIVRNLPYTDARRNGKVPKLLVHRLFPNAKFSIWIDGKLQLLVDPYQILERFLWRSRSTFAISRHYRRFDVFDEAEANKAAGKYSNASIDQQIEFYKNEGLTHYSPAKLPITSDVPEGCVIIREHIPISNLFTCLWFNEVHRFTSRDQICFSTVRDKIMSRVNWTVNMFLDCERRNFVVQAYHRDLLEQRKALAVSTKLAPPATVNDIHVLNTVPVQAVPVRATPLKVHRKVSPRRGKERKRRRKSGIFKDNSG